MTINSICRLAAGACRSSLACSVTGKAAASGARTATRLRSELKTSRAPGPSAAVPATSSAPRFLTYFDGGFTQARFDQINYNFSGVGGLGGPTGTSLPAQTYNGWFVGSGFEYAFDWLPIPGLFLKTEYRYSQYNSATPSFVTTATACRPASRSTRPSSPSSCRPNWSGASTGSAATTDRRRTFATRARDESPGLFVALRPLALPLPCHKKPNILALPGASGANDNEAHEISQVLCRIRCCVVCPCRAP